MRKENKNTLEQNIDETIVLNDGTDDVEFEIIATFGVDDKDYALLEAIHNGEQVILEVVQEDEEMLFQPIADDREFEEVQKALLELWEDEKSE